MIVHNATPRIARRLFFTNADFFVDCSVVVGTVLTICSCGKQATHEQPGYFRNPDFDDLRDTITDFR